VIAAANSISATSFVWVAESAGAVPPTIVTQPFSQAVAAGTNVTFSVAATGTGPLVYQWQHDHTNIAGAIARDYSITNVQTGDNGVYAVVVSNRVDQVTSAEATLSVNTPPRLPAIASRTIHAGSTLSFTNAAGDPDVPAQSLTYRLDAGAPPGASIGAATGVFVWNTTAAEAGGTNLITVRVTDDGTPALSDAKSFTVTLAAPLNFQSTETAGGQFTLIWNSLPGTRYRVLRVDEVTATNWIPLVPDIVATGTTASVSEPVAASQRFYRVQTVH
jgi:hypothetical protein